jgi:hypothetical protein
VQVFAASRMATHVSRGRPPMGDTVQASAGDEDLGVGSACRLIQSGKLAPALRLRTVAYTALITVLGIVLYWALLDAVAGGQFTG